MLEPYNTLANYNRWMNEKLYACCAQLPDEERKRDCHAPFGSMHGTLNHLLLVDRIWLGNISRSPFPFSSLSDELYRDFSELREERARTDEEICALVATLDEARLCEPLRWKRGLSPARREAQLWLPLMQMFNHQTHHRGQLTTLLEQAGADFGVTDLPLLPGAPVRELHESSG